MCITYFSYWKQIKTMLTFNILLSARVAQSIINKSRSGKTSNKSKSTVVYRGVTREEPVVGVCLKDDGYACG